METFLLCLSIVALSMAAMAAGLLVRGRPLQGGCRGTGCGEPCGGCAVDGAPRGVQER